MDASRGMYKQCVILYGKDLILKSQFDFLWQDGQSAYIVINRAQA